MIIKLYNINFEHNNISLLIVGADFMYKKVFITCSGTGIGKDTAIALAKRGNLVFEYTHYEE